MRVEAVQEHFGEAVEVKWRSFMLRTEPKTSDLAKFIDYTKSWQRCAETEPAARFTTPWASDSGAPSSSLPAQVAWKSSAAFGAEAQQRMHRNLLDAYFAHNRDISSGPVLVDLADKAGIDPETFAAMMTDNHAELARQVIDEHNTALNQGITAVPTVVLGGALPVPGAQPTETYVRLIDRMLDR